jgi:hypothetical protein
MKGMAMRENGLPIIFHAQRPLGPLGLLSRHGLATIRVYLRDGFDCLSFRAPTAFAGE